MPIIYMSDKKRKLMNEVNKQLAENLGEFFMLLSTEVIKGLQLCIE